MTRALQVDELLVALRGLAGTWNRAGQLFTSIEISSLHSVTDCTACEVIAAASCTEEDGYFSCEYFETPSQTHTHTQTSLLLPPLCKYSSILHDSAEASLVVPEFTISVYGSSCNYLFWSQSLFFSWHFILPWECQ